MPIASGSFVIGEATCFRMMITNALAGVDDCCLLVAPSPRLWRLEQDKILSLVKSIKPILEQQAQFDKKQAFWTHGASSTFGITISARSNVNLRLKLGGYVISPVTSPSPQRIPSGFLPFKSKSIRRSLSLNLFTNPAAAGQPCRAITLRRSRFHPPWIDCDVCNASQRPHYSTSVRISSYRPPPWIDCDVCNASQRPHYSTSVRISSYRPPPFPRLISACNASQRPHYSTSVRISSYRPPPFPRLISAG
ncbi:hypothetical protein RRG08_010154 [Elysia crispata]|uniref:Uncharacterized protein n=1 Tax=Elysia crispata TaxID=231223 RepID=A0AAE1AJD5_9GAST|nr:hypothetical protein RRG08_010154 [Elysia crispata]